MDWFGKVKKDEEKPRPRYSVIFWNKCDGSITSKQLDIIPRVGEKVHIPNYDPNYTRENSVSWLQCGKFYEVIQVYHFIEADGDGAKIIVVIDEPP